MKKVVAFCHAKYKFALDEVSDNKETLQLWRVKATAVEIPPLGVLEAEA